MPVNYRNLSMMAGSFTALAFTINAFKKQRDPALAQTKTNVYTFAYRIRDRQVRIDLFADSSEAAIKHINNLNTIFRKHTVAELTDAFCEPQFKSPNTYTLSDCKEMLNAYKTAITEKSNAPVYDVIENSNPDATYFGRRFSEYSLLFTIFTNKSARELSSFWTNLSVLDPSIFPKYLTQRRKAHYGSNPNLDSVISAYTAACRSFNEKHNNTLDPVELGLAYQQLLIDLKKIFNGDTRWVPELCVNREQETARFLHKGYHQAMRREGYLAMTSGKKSISGITPLMYVVTRPCEIGRDVDQCLKSNLILAESYLSSHDVNEQDKWGRTALFYVALNDLMFSEQCMPGRAKMTELLLNAGADPTIRDRLGLTALDYFQMAEKSSSKHAGTQMLEKLQPNKQTVKPKARA